MNSPDNPYVSRAALKLAGAAERFRLDFRNKVILDVGSSTGGFTDYALHRGAKKVIAVDIGTNQMHPRLSSDERIELHEKTDILKIALEEKPDIVLVDVSFVSLREILPAVAKLSGLKTQIVTMVKPQFEAHQDELNRGVVKNETIRRDILKTFEAWSKKIFKIEQKADSQVAGSKGNIERFYLLRRL